MKSIELRWLAIIGSFAGFALFSSCGGGSHSSSSSASGSSSPPPSNSQPLVVNGGPNNNYANGLFTSVTVCAPGTSSCQTIGGVLVDTGSYGLRVLSSALGSLNNSLPQQTDTSGNSVVECAQFVSNVIWGPVKTADVEIAGEKASSLPVEIIDSSTIPVPAACKALGSPQETLASLGANGILGIGFFVQDCGSTCASSGSSNPGFYYSCMSSSCTVTSESTTLQVQNPVAFFTTDNNGVVLELPSSQNAPSASGTLLFGIASESNNSLGSAQVFKPDTSGNVTTTFKGTNYSGFLDSGSNAYFFLNSTTTGIAACPSPQNGFYCPSSPVNLSATIASGTTTNVVNFTIGNASQLFSMAGDFVFPTLGGPNASVFDWGLPFFFGRNVFVAIEGRQTPAGAGPFWAY
jgi:Protein of unknown function (DUF3443)